MSVNKITYSKKYGAICILDALGTKGVWKQRNPESVIENWENYVNAVERNLKISNNQINYNIYAFSDTLIITCSGNLPIEKILLDLGINITVAISYGLPYGIFLRGCISIGDFYESQKMILGPAIDEAAQYYEIANWIGVHLAPSAFSAMDRLIPITDNLLVNHYKLYPTPLKNGGILNTYVIALGNLDLKSVFDASGLSKEAPLLEEERTILDFIHYRLEHLTDVEGSDKWKNTLDCLNFMNKHFKINTQK